MGQEECELMSLPLSDLERMSIEFPDAYAQLLGTAVKRLKILINIKLCAIKYCKQNLRKGKDRDSGGDMFVDDFIFVAIDIREIDNPDVLSKDLKEFMDTTAGKTDEHGNEPASHEGHTRSHGDGHHFCIF